MKKSLPIWALICAILFLAAGCSSKTIFSSASEPVGSASAAAETEASEPLPEETPLAQLEDAVTTYPVQVTDLNGFESTVSSADRIISLTPSNTEILISVGVMDRVVGVDASSADMVPDADVVGDYTGPDTEAIVALEPDVIFAGNTIQRETIEQLRNIGLTVIESEATRWDDVGASFELVGRAVNENEAAAQLVQQLQGTVADVETLAPAQQLTCYYVLSFGEGGNWTSGEGSFINDMIQYAGGVPTTKDTASPWLEYPLEDLIAADPNCIILSSEAGSYADLEKEPGYADLTAVRNGQVFSIDSDIVTRPGPNLNEGLLAVSGILNAAAAGPVREAAAEEPPAE